MTARSSERLEPHATNVSDRRPPKPVCAFRIGITGARALSPEVQPVVRRQIEEMLRAVAADAETACATIGTAAVYRAETSGAVRPKLRIVSPLADGADRLLAEVAESIGGYELDVALPFTREEYARDFDDAGRADFERWLAVPSVGSRIIELDGGRDADGERTDDANRSYEAVGRLVVRNCDLLVAVWDGGPAKGRGGTAEIVQFAALVGPPIWWIDATGVAPPRLIRTASDLRWDEAPRGDAARRTLTEIITRDLVPPTEGRPARHGLIGHVAHLLGMKGHAADDQLLAYLDEQGRPRRGWWQTHRWFMRLVVGSPDYRAAAPKGTGGFWERQYTPADAASIEYRDRYRSSYVLLFLFAPAAVACVVVSLAFSWLETYLAPLELASLVAIAALVALNQRRDWQARWIAYRLLAELCRKQEALAPLGWSLPPVDLRLMGKSGSPAPWVGWYFNALLRAAPLATGRLRDGLPRIRDLVCAKLISGQEAYHQDRKTLSKRAAHRLSQAGELLFLGTCAIVIVKLSLLAIELTFHAEALHGPIVDLSVVAAILPALSAALFGIRAYAELELLEQQSARLEQTMREAGQRIGKLPLDHTLASQDLAAEVFDLATAMLQDVDGWAMLFNLKAVEAG